MKILFYFYSHTLSHLSLLSLSLALSLFSQAVTVVGQFGLQLTMGLGLRWFYFCGSLDDRFVLQLIVGSSLQYFLALMGGIGFAVGLMVV
jgi:hypothetical protein